MEELLHYPKEANGFVGLTRGTVMRRPHTHRELEVNLVVSGRAAYLVGARRVPLLTGSMIWLFPRQEHLLIDCSSDFSMWVLVFRPALVAQCADRDTRRILASPDPGEVLSRQVSPARVEALNRLCQGAIDEQGDLAFLNATLHYALVESWRAWQFSGELIPSTQVHPAVARAARIVTDADAALSLDDVARQAGLSPARLSRLFQQQVGVTLTAFRQQKCLERFLRLYGAGARHSLIEAALLAGFGSYPQFHRVFCRLMKVSPLAYKRRFRADLAPAAKASAREPAKPAAASARPPSKPAETSVRVPAERAETSRAPSKLAAASVRTPSKSAETAARAPSKPAAASVRVPSKPTAASARAPAERAVPAAPKKALPTRRAKRFTRP